MFKGIWMYAAGAVIGGAVFFGVATFLTFTPDGEFKVEKTYGKVTLTCMSDQCTLKNVLFDRGNKSGNIYIGMDYRLNEKNYPNTVVTSGDGFNVGGTLVKADMKTGNLTAADCTDAGAGLLMMAPLIPAVHCKAAKQTEVRMAFSDQVVIGVPEMEGMRYVEVKVNGCKPVPLTYFDVASRQSAY